MEDKTVIEALSYGFIQHALLAGLLVSFAAGIIGSLIVVNRMVFLAGGIAHASYGGIGLAVFFGLPVFLGASIFAVLTAILVSVLTLKKRQRLDTFIGLIWAVGMAIGIIFIDFTPGYNVDMMSYLFGSILAVSREDLYYMTGLLGLIVAVVSIWYRDILAVSYDSEYATLRGVNVRLLYPDPDTFRTDGGDRYQGGRSDPRHRTAYHSCLYRREALYHTCRDDDTLGALCSALYTDRTAACLCL